MVRIVVGLVAVLVGLWILFALFTALRAVGAIVQLALVVAVVLLAINLIRTALAHPRG